MDNENEDLRRTVAELKTALELAQRRIEHLTNEVLRLKRLGTAGPAEAGQELFAFADAPALGDERAVDDGTEQPRHKHGRRSLPQNLPRERREYHPPESERFCAGCGKPKERIGAEVSEQLEYVPSSLKVIEHARIKYACPRCRDGVSVGPLPEKVIDKGLPGEGLLAQVLVNKYEDHLPLYRQEANVFKRHGLAIPRSTMCQWIARSVELLAPIYRCMRAEVPKSRKIHTDDTSVPLPDPKLGRTRSARLWVYLGDDKHRHAYYEFTQSRSRDGPAKYLSGYAGHLQADAYGGYDGLYVSGVIKEVACWAHVRRKFDEARATDPRAVEMLAFIRQLYDVEDEARNLPETARLILRQERSVPVLERVKGWLDARVLDVLPKSPLGQAARYCQSQWTALTRYCDDGVLEADNNAAERALRAVAVGRKNWLFCANENGGYRAAVIYSLVYSCKLNGVDPWTYLKDVLVRISHHPARNILDLTPMFWKSATQTV